ncbi:MAG: TOBE domain-containing protein, partial [Spirochaetales bacterium]|nr:TOBE domain-containing protein [Spirochaetales bacterium]
MVMSDYVAVMNAGQFEQLDTPQNLYSNPAYSFVAQFVGNNNKFRVDLKKDESGKFFAATKSGDLYTLSDSFNLQNSDFFDMFVRPEAIIINPSNPKPELNIINADVKAILFDGGNSRLLVTPEKTEDEIIVALPQNRQFDHIKAKDSIKIGWDPEAAVCFNRMEKRIYDDEI